MAATLPSIHTGGDLISAKSPVTFQHVPSPPNKSAASGTRIIVMGAKRSQSKKERELEQRKLTLRAQQINLSKAQTVQYRNAYKHNLCLDMMQDGFHKSFSELFALIKRQNEERENAGPESVLWNQSLLEQEPEKLDTLKEYLTKAEASLRQGQYGEVYKCQFKLARYFQGTGDKWLVDHFFESCLKTAADVKGDEGKMAAEGHCNVGLALEESGDLQGAAQNYENFYELTSEHTDWTYEEDKYMHCEACNHLARIYTNIAFQHEEVDNKEMYLSYLNQACDMAVKGGDKQLQGEASYRLGVAFEKNKDPETALVYLNKYLEICRSVGDNKGVGKACEAMAKAYERQGKVEESIRYLEMFVEVAEESKDDKGISRACSDLGAMFNSLGRYDQAVDYFNRSYNISRSLNDTEAISSSRVLFGVAAAHKMLQNVSNHVETGSWQCIERLVEWKDNRGDEFDKGLPKAGDEKEEDKKEEEKKE